MMLVMVSVCIAREEGKEKITGRLYRLDGFGFRGWGAWSRGLWSGWVQPQLRE